DLKADQTPIQVGVLLIVADADCSVVEKRRVDVEQILNIQRHLCASQPSGCLPRSLITQLQIDGRPRRHTPARYANSVSIAVFEVDESSGSEAATLPCGGAARAQINRVVLRADYIVQRRGWRIRLLIAQQICRIQAILS